MDSTDLHLRDLHQRILAARYTLTGSFYDAFYMIAAQYQRCRTAAQYEAIGSLCEVQLSNEEQPSDVMEAYRTLQTLAVWRAQGGQ